MFVVVGNFWISLPNTQIFPTTFSTVFHVFLDQFFSTVFNKTRIKEIFAVSQIQRMCELNCTQSVGIIVYNGYKSRNYSGNIK